MKILLNKNSISAKEFSLDARKYLSDVLALRGFRVSTIKDAEGKDTGAIDCVRYDLVDTSTYAEITVKVPNSKPVISQSDLDASENPIYVELPLDQVEIHPFEIAYGNARVTITAPFIKLSEINN